ncbi:PREDICTED: Williams-Beuren syndrome chromosomal region 27 protein-like [Branchiostoma belcheri]|uniref:Williams-Beuren syndrome chromosomal region 27 protein-like n=1 Tax=Branchiostoma belcheri TaxID=7741 RepID=A0A6P4YCH7_BRABE|nr:PREDICTED: Williams-Beuren syndrome chromosomal region 27 protein-like [Branchiostoma belcheri]
MADWGSKLDKSNDKRKAAVGRPDITLPEVIQAYDTWAEDYDKDHVGVFGGPFLSSAALAKVLGDNRDALILDLGAGTGLCAEELSKLSFKNVDAIDASQKMLDIAAQKGLYRKYICAIVTNERLDIEDDTYDGIVSSGAFNWGHLKVNCLPELIRIVKPGGYISFIMREECLWKVPEYKDRLEPAMLELQNTGAWERVSRDIVLNYLGEINGIVYTYRVTAQGMPEERLRSF